MSSYITRIKKQEFKKWFVINLEIQELPESVLCSEAKVLHSYLASRDESYQYKRSDAIMLLGSSYKVDKAVSQLKSIGLIEIKKIKGEGRFKGNNWTINLSLKNIINTGKNQ